MASKLRGLCVATGLSILLVLIEGCGGIEKREYVPNSADQKVNTLPLKLAVVEFEDRNPGLAYSYGTYGPGISKIPGVLYGTAAVGYYPTQFGRCLAEELEASKIFANVAYHRNWEQLAEHFLDYDLIITGRLNQDRVEVTEYTYGLSVLAMYLHMFLGVPSHSYYRNVEFEVSAFRPTLPLKKLWAHTVKFDDSQIAGWYGRGGDMGDLGRNAQHRNNSLTHSDFCTTEKLQPEFLRLTRKLENNLREIPIVQKQTAERILP